MLSNIREKYYAGADNDLREGDGHVFPPFSSSSWLNLLQNSSNVGEKRGDATRPVSQPASGREGTSSDHEDVDDDSGSDAKAEQW